MTSNQVWCELIKFALMCEEPNALLRAWNHGEFARVSAEWPEAPDCLKVPPPDPDAEIMEVMLQRDDYHRWADDLALGVARLTGVDIGEHSSDNSPWHVAAAAVEECLSAKPTVSPPAEAAPVPMIMHCPLCNGRHIDTGTFATKRHHTHACQHCGYVWRPAIVATIGVRFLPGFKDET